MSKGPWGRPSLPGVSGPCPRPAVPTSCPGRLGPGSQVPWARPDVLGDLVPGSSAREVDQLARAPQARVPGPTESTSCPGRLGPMPEVPGARPDVPGDRGPGSSACGVDQLSQAPRARIEGQRDPSALPGDSSSGPRAAGSTSCPRGHAAGSDSPRGRPAVRGDSGQCPRAHDVDQLSRATRTGFRGPAGSTSTAGRHALVSEGPRVMSPRCPGRLALGSSAPGVDKLSRVTQAQVRDSVGSTSSPGRSGPVSEFPCS